MVANLIEIAFVDFTIVPKQKTIYALSMIFVGVKTHSIRALLHGWRIFS